MVIIYLSSTLLLGSICLPSIIERAVLRRWFMWHFSMQGLPAEDVTIISRELLPHVFSLTPALSKGEGEGSYFLWHCLLFVSFDKLRMTNTRLFTGALLCAVRTFLPILRWSDNPACSNNFKEAIAKILADSRIKPISLIFLCYMSSKTGNQRQ